MGKTSQNRIIVLICLLIAAGAAAYLKPASTASVKATDLNQVLKNIDGWQYRGFVLFDEKVVDALALDDYVNNRYVKDNEHVSLYIGYYLSTKKVGAAHDPMVCFPGQGWVLSERSTGELQLNDAHATISYSTMTAQLGQQKELLVYWFQSYDHALPDTFRQKLSLFWKKLWGHGEDNAFVRITVPMEDGPVEKYRQTAFRFIEAFYPAFLDYVTSSVIR